MANEINVYSAADTNSPGYITGANTASLLTILDAILVNGYTPASVVSITRSGNTATATLNAADNGLYVGGYYTIAGATQPEYNGKQRITSVISSTQFTFTVTGTPATPATGTITYFKSPAGWTKLFSANNKTSYQTSSVNNPTQVVMNVDDNASTAALGKEATIRGYEAMTDVNTGTGAFGTYQWRKSSTTDTTSRNWKAIADDRSIYIFIANGDQGTTQFFGRFTTFKTGDAYNYINCGNFSTNSSTGYCGLFNAAGITTNIITSGSTICRAVSQVGGAISCTVSRLTSSVATATGDNQESYIAYPNSADGAVWTFPYLIKENSGSIIRGQFPGCVIPIHNATVGSLGDLVTNIAGYSGKTFMILTGSNATYSGVGRIFVDITGPWA